MKGVILSINPTARIVDLTHTIRPQDIRHACYFLATATPYYPPGTIHVCVVDPGVGSERAALHAVAGGQHFVGPDNGVFTAILRKAGGAAVVRRLADRRFWRPRVSDTFHGRDIFAPVAAHLSLGVDPSALGPELADPVELPIATAVTFGKQWQRGSAVRRRLRQPHHQHPGVQAEVAAGEGLAGKLDAGACCPGRGPTRKQPRAK